jgi:hypothetical protein
MDDPLEQAKLYQNLSIAYRDARPDSGIGGGLLPDEKVAPNPFSARIGDQRQQPRQPSDLSCTKASFERKCLSLASALLQRSRAADREISFHKRAL